MSAPSSLRRSSQAILGLAGVAGVLGVWLEIWRVWSAWQVGPDLPRWFSAPAWGSAYLLILLALSGFLVDTARRPRP